jgi:hypothetical protein
MASADAARSIVTELGKWPLEGVEGKEVRLLTVEHPPGVHTPPHREWWFEPREHLHVDAGNDSPDTATKILVFYVTEPGQPVLVPESGAAT